ncbi:MAG: valine--tRNA ligase [candidate division Zixibacteria bacterium]|nr:valine--tRNA ligase [candidate division Zixibacteria bacterium]
MTKFQLPKNYDPHAAEEKWNAEWEANAYFHADPTSDRPKYTIVIPPPNVTGVLHLGHALNNTMQDIMVRYKRMNGHESEWLPGIDHAGIATQVVVEKQVIAEGGTREGLGREEFIKRVWQWKDKNGDRIIEQLRLMGCSCDWRRTRFTLDEGLSEAVKEVFIRLYEKDLIYQGTYIVNWCPRCLTTLSDDELEREDRDSSLWYVKYPLADGSGHLAVATTRPETMLGDTAVAVNPKDDRYKGYIGKSVILPLMGREIPIIGDEYIEMEFGTGVLKVTPAHDVNDFEIGRRHKLDSVSVIDDRGIINENGGKYKGLDRDQARKRVVADLEREDLLEKTEPHRLGAAICYRCSTVIEPYLSEQWFVKMSALAPPAIEAVKSGRIRFHPRHWSKVYLHWMENIHDWCISRQLWWGHRIPVYTHKQTGEMIVAKTHPGDDYVQDEDVLDTWFSSWLWPFSTFGWPEKTPELKSFYPTDSLFTASEIIFLWVARMVMAGCEFMNEIPFSDVYIHGTVRDAIGRRMSKSLGNGIDPVDVVEQHGADALRLSLVLAAPEGQDPLISEKTFEQGRNFANKLWNASRLVLANQPDEPAERIDLKASRDDLHLSDRWILSRMNEAIRDFSGQLDDFRFNTASKTLYDFIWSDFCDWYLELVKPRFYLKEDTQERRLARQVSLEVVGTIVRLLHPMAPFVTEELWSHLKDRLPDDVQTEHVTAAVWPAPDADWIDEELDASMRHVFNVIGAIRNVRSEMKIPAGKEISCVIRVNRKRLLRNLRAYEENIRILGKIGDLTMDEDVKKPVPSASAVIRDAEIFIPLEGLIDLEAERKRLQKDLEHHTQQLERINRKLDNADFLNNAPAEVVEKERAKRENFEMIVARLNANLEQLVGW